MFALTLDLLSGRYIATTYNDRDQAEWPPHPARLFSALVATWAEHEPGSADGEAEVQALRWLERQDAPVIWASSLRDTAERTVMPVFVPVNDVSVVREPSREKLDDALAERELEADDKKAAKLDKDIEKLRTKLEDDTAKAVAPSSKPNKGDGEAIRALLPEGRTKQPRTFPSVRPECSTVGFVWPASEAPQELVAALQRLARRLVRVGHSASLVRAEVHVDIDAIEALRRQTEAFEPDPDRGELVIRWVAPGQVEALGRAFDLHRETEPRVLPATFIRYREGARRLDAAAPTSMFGTDALVFARVDGPRLPITAVAGVARQLRRALMANADQPIPEFLSGHAGSQAESTPSTRPHLAVVPLPFVAHQHADGSVLGVALVFPRHADEAERTAVRRAVARLEALNRTNDESRYAPATIALHLGDAGSLGLRRIDGEQDARSTLNMRTWSAPSHHWATATPVALDRNPGDLHDQDPARRRQAFDAAADSIRASLHAIGVNIDGVRVDVLRSCVLPGTAKPRSYPRFPSQTDRAQRVLVHARLTFPIPVGGPILLGSGRFQGLGLFRPVLPNKEEQNAAEPLAADEAVQ